MNTEYYCTTSPCSILTQNPLLGFIYSKWWLNQWHTRIVDCFLFSLSRLKSWDWTPSAFDKSSLSQKRMQMSHLALQSLGLYLIKLENLMNIAIWPDLTFLNWAFWRSMSVGSSISALWAVWKLVTKSWLNLAKSWLMNGEEVPIFHLLTQNLCFC